MATVEEADFQIPVIEERDDLRVADVNLTSRQAGSIAAAADRASIVANIVLGVDQKAAEDAFTGQLEAMALPDIPNNLAPVVYVAVGAEDDSGVWTPSHVVRGHDGLATKDGYEDIPQTYVWADMYANRPAAWWNKTRRDGGSELVKVPLQIVLADVALRATNKEWDKQQDELDKLIREGHDSDAVTVEGMPILAWPMMDADAIIHGSTERPDKETVTRFVQHDMDRAGAGWSCGPCADVYGRKAYLDRSYGRADPDIGFRAVMGQKQTD